VYFHDYGGQPAHHGYSIQHTEKIIDEVLNIIEDAFLLVKTKPQAR
jgi:hypothetical protein